MWTVLRKGTLWAGPYYKVPFLRTVYNLIHKHRWRENNYLCPNMRKEMVHHTSFSILNTIPYGCNHRVSRIVLKIIFRLHLAKTIPSLMSLQNFQTSTIFNLFVSPDIAWSAVQKTSSPFLKNLWRKLKLPPYSVFKQYGGWTPNPSCSVIFSSQNRYKQHPVHSSKQL